MKWGNFLLIFISAVLLLLIPYCYFQSDSNDTSIVQYEPTDESPNE